MKKKILALILVIVMALSLLPMSALAAPDISATYSKSAKTVTVTVDGVTEKVPNVNNNSTVTVEVNGWKVIVDAKNDVATIKSKEKLASTVDTNEEVGTAIESKDTTTNLRTFRMEQTWNKTTYHCGYEQGGPRVVPTEYTGTPALNTAALKNNTKIWLNLQEVPGTTKWELVSVEIDGAIYTAPVCPKCGSTEWVSFSNNSGVPDGKNMQMCHREVKDPPPVDPKGALSIYKTVDGKLLDGEWSIYLSGTTYTILDVVDSLKFYLYAVSGNGEPVPPGASPAAVGELDLSGSIIFAAANGEEELSLAAGWYAVVEVISAPADEVFEDVGPQYFYIGAKDADGNYQVDGSGKLTYNPGDKFTFNDLHIDSGTWPGTSNLRFYAWANDYNGKDAGNIRPGAFSVTDENNNIYPAFCAKYGSLANVPGYEVGEIAPETKARLISALNYINNNWNTANGGLFDTFNYDGDYRVSDPGSYGGGQDLWDSFMAGQNRVYPKALAQFVVWAIIHDEMYISPWAEGHTDNGVGKEVFDRIVNVESRAGHTGVIKDVLFLVGTDDDWAQPVVVPIPGGGTFDNKPKDPVDPKGAFDIEKTIDGELAGSWEVDGVDYWDVYEDLSFTLYAATVDSSGNPDGYDDSVIYGTGELNMMGLIEFTTISKDLTGWYAVVETITPGTIAAEIFEDVGPLYIYLNNTTIAGGIDMDFDYGAFYTIVNGYGWTGSRTLNYPGLNNAGDLFYIGVTNTTTGTEYPSFCAHAGSKNFAGESGLDCTGYMCSASLREIEGIPFDLFLAAFNYINDNLPEALNVNREMNSSRAVAQTVVWALLGAVDVQTEAFMQTNLTDGEKTLVIDALTAAYAGYTGQGKIVDVAYLVCEKNHDFGTCQPQIVPIFGDYVEVKFDNKTEELVDPKGTMNATIDITGERDVITYDYTPNTTTKSGSITADARGSTTANWFGATFVNVEQAKENPVVVSQLRTGNGDNDIIGVGFNIRIDTSGDVWIDLGDIVTAGASVQLLEIVNGKGVQNNNGHHNTYSGSFNTGLNVGDAEVVCVYVHFDSITYFNGTYTRYEASKTSEEVDYTGSISLVVKNEVGDPVFECAGTLVELIAAGYLDIMGEIIITGSFDPGTYTATLSGDGFADIVLEGTIVDDGDRISFVFDPIFVSYPARVIDPGYPA